MSQRGTNAAKLLTEWNETFGQSPATVAESIRIVEPPAGSFRYARNSSFAVWLVEKDDDGDIHSALLFVLQMVIDKSEIPSATFKFKNDMIAVTNAYVSKDIDYENTVYKIQKVDGDEIPTTYNSKNMLKSSDLKNLSAAAAAYMEQAVRHFRESDVTVIELGSKGRPDVTLDPDHQLKRLNVIKWQSLRPWCKGIEANLTQHVRPKSRFEKDVEFEVKRNNQYIVNLLLRVVTTSAKFTSEKVEYDERRDIEHKEFTKLFAISTYSRLVLHEQLFPGDNKPREQKMLSFKSPTAGGGSGAENRVSKVAYGPKTDDRQSKGKGREPQKTIREVDPSKERGGIHSRLGVRETAKKGSSLKRPLPSTSKNAPNKSIKDRLGRKPGGGSSNSLEKAFSHIIL